MYLQPDDIVGEYRIDRPLGRGGIGAVYKATHLISQRSEALKVLLPEQMSTPDMMERFRREIQLLASLNHPNIARLHHAFRRDEQLVMVMELVEGEDLRTLGGHAALALPQLLDLAAQVLQGLDYAHRSGVVHRDVKPANIMVTPTGTAKLLDFGIAISDQTAHLTVAGSMIGSPTYMSPEQIRGDKATLQSDLYSLGVTLYEVIAGRAPLVADNTAGLLLAHIQQVPPSLQTLRPDVPDAVAVAIAKALEKNPADRFATALDFRDALRCDGLADQDAVPAAITTPIRSTQVSPAHTSTDVATFNREPLVRDLATFIGPIAKVVVARLLKQTGDVDTLYAECAKQIENESDRQMFLQIRRRSG